jgi:hypothetical protein
MRNRRILTNNRGSMSMDFIFALVLVVGFTAIFGAMALTLSAVESIQYIAFSTSRVYNAAHLSQEKQNELAETKFAQLRESQGLKQFLNNNWFDLKLRVGNFSEEYQKVDPRDNLEGIVIDVTAKLLEIRIPFFGQTTSEEDGFQARVTSFLGREPTSEECARFNSERWQVIQDLIPNADRAPSDAYTALMDNGC